MKIAIFGSRNRKIEQIKTVFETLLKNEAEVLVQKKFYEHMLSIGLKYDVSTMAEGEDFDADLVISIGGDGTFLRAASVIGKKDIPIFGVNAGRLGFLADVKEKDLEDALNEILAGKYRVEHRSQLQLSTQERAFCGFNYALNEIAVLKQDTASMITVHAQINGEYLNSYEADGLIIATPTGSTAYSMSVGGPILTPTSSSFVLSPVAPHTLNMRPLVVDNDCVITLDVESRNGSFLISLDGRSDVFTVGTRLTIKKAEFSLKVVKRIGHTFYSTLRDKLMWGADSRLNQ